MKDRAAIITSVLDNDLYTLTVGEVVYHDFHKAVVSFDFINRGKTKFPPGFADELRKQIILLSKVRLTPDEEAWLYTVPFLRRTYIEWLRSYQFDPSEVTITQEDGDLKIHIKGYWYRTIFWEVPLMAIISELYFDMTGQLMAEDWTERMDIKGKKLSAAGCHWIDFVLVAVVPIKVQDELVKRMKEYNGFLGTSNMHFAMKYGLKAHGTYSHQGPMGISALYGVRMANKMWMKHWSDHYEGSVGVALTDTFTTEVFLRDFDGYYARLFDGSRQDSGDPYKWGDDMVAHYRRLNIPMSNKRMVFSDNLTTDKYIALDKHFRQFGQPCGGIGTHFSNDCGVRPLNMVIKLTSLNGIPIVKLSDDLSKATGDPNAIRRTKEELNIL